jgi:hypothetical protein
MKQKKDDQMRDSAGVRKLVNEIRTEQQKIDRSEGEVVAAQLRIAYHLAELRVLAKGRWGRQLEGLGMNPRVASRYLKLAQHWPARIGLTESDLLPRLPPDLLKLEWLCRIPPASLNDLLDKLDCKKANRSQIIAAVREMLGEAPAAKDEIDVDRFVRRLTGPLRGAVERLHETFPDLEDQHRAREELHSELTEILQALSFSGADGGRS